MIHVECHPVDESDGNNILGSHRSSLPYYLNRITFHYGEVHAHPVEAGQIDHQHHINLNPGHCNNRYNTASHIRERVRGIHRTRRGLQKPSNISQAEAILEYR